MSKKNEPRYASEQALIERLLADDSLSVDNRGALMAVRKTGIYDDRIRLLVREYGEEMSKSDSAKALAKAHKDEAEKKLEEIRTLRQKTDDLGDLIVLAEHETQFIRESDELRSASPVVYELAFNTDLRDLSEYSLKEVQAALAYVGQWERLGHFHADRKRELEAMQRTKTEANADARRPGARTVDLRNADAPQAAVAT